jgi:hypothetical protein
MEEMMRIEDKFHPVDLEACRTVANFSTMRFQCHELTFALHFIITDN